MVDNRCVVCGEIIPEGRQVCPTCEVMRNKELEELATELYILFRSHPMSKAMARHLYDKGWRKQNEGEWEQRTDVVGFVRCSVCKDCNVYDEWADGKKWKYCPNCGAKMKGGE